MSLNTWERDKKDRQFMNVVIGDLILLGFLRCMCHEELGGVSGNYQGKQNSVG